MKAINIKWDVDCLEDLKDLPEEIEIPNDLFDDGYENDRDGYMEEVSDYISDVTGFCHFGFDLTG